MKKQIQRIILAALLAVTAWPRITQAQSEGQEESASAGERTGQAPASRSDSASSDADSAKGDGPAYERGGLAGAGFVLGAKVGGGFAQPFGKLGASFLTELELGYMLPYWRRALEVFVSGAYTQPQTQGKNLMDERLPGPASYKLTQQEAMVTLGLVYRVRLSTDLFRPYVAAGPRMYLMRTKISGDAGGQAFGDNQETAMKIGVYGALGAELHLGPGAVLLEASLAWAKIDGFVMRNTSAGAVNVSVGYRLFI